MSEIFQFLGQIIGKTENLAVLVSIGFAVLMAWMLVNARKEDREDRKAFVEALEKNTDAIVGLKVALAALSGRVA